MNIDQLREQLKIDEGVKYEIYNDHLGYATFGIGHLVVKGDEEHGKPIGTPVSEERVNSVFDSDVATYVTEAKKVFPNLDTLPEEAQEVIVICALIWEHQDYLNLRILLLQLKMKIGNVQEMKCKTVDGISKQPIEQIGL